MAKETPSRQNCPIKKDAVDAANLGSEMLKTMRRLRRELLRCPRCPDFDDCPVLAEFRATIDEVLWELYEEWGLS
jgi:hypothetical protein